jgi:hypothetical protein
MIAIKHGTILPVNMISSEHTRIELITSDSIQTDNSQMDVVLSKIGVSNIDTFRSTVTTHNTHNTHTVNFLVLPSGSFDLVGGRLKFHEAMSCEYLKETPVVAVVIGDNARIGESSVFSVGVIANGDDLKNISSGSSKRKRSNSDTNNNIANDNTTNNTTSNSLNTQTDDLTHNIIGVISTDHCCPISHLTKGVVEGFIRETLEELNFNEYSEVKRRECVNNVHYIYCVKESVNILLTIRKIDSMFLYVVEISNY